MSSPLVLGTVQLGMAYGINNPNGQPDLSVAKAMVHEAFSQGIVEFDTAQGYGQSETVLGLAFSSFKINDKVKVITKLDPILSEKQPATLIKGIHDSLEKLGVSSLGVLMLHREEQLSIWTAKLYPLLRPLQRVGKIKYFGVSVYTPQAAKLALETEGIDRVQIPSNILDNRFERAGIFSLARTYGKELYVRSVYLQGLLLMEHNKIPVPMQYALPFLTQLKALAEQYNVTIKELCLGYVLAKWPTTKVIVGAETITQVSENCRIARKPRK